MATDNHHHSTIARTLRKSGLIALMLKGRWPGPKSMSVWCHECMMIERVDQFLYGETTRMVDPSVTTAMLPIIPADYNYTIITVTTLWTFKMHRPEPYRHHN